MSIIKIIVKNPSLSMRSQWIYLYVLLTTLQEPYWLKIQPSNEAPNILYWKSKIDTMCGGANLFLFELIKKSLLRLKTNSIITPKKRKFNINNRRKNMQNVHKSNKNNTWSTNNDNLFFINLVRQQLVVMFIKRLWCIERDLQISIVKIQVIYSHDSTTHKKTSKFTNEPIQYSSIIISCCTQ